MFPRDSTYLYRPRFLRSEHRRPSYVGTTAYVETCSACSYWSVASESWPRVEYWGHVWHERLPTMCVLGRMGIVLGQFRDCRMKLDTQSFSTERDHKGNCAVSQKSTASWRYFTKLKVKVLTAIRAWTPIQEKKVGSFGPDLLWLALPNAHCIVFMSEVLMFLLWPTDKGSFAGWICCWSNDFDYLSMKLSRVLHKSIW